MVATLPVRGARVRLRAVGTGEGGLVAFVGWIAVRTRWRTYAGITVLIAVMVGLSLCTLAGARRTQSSYDRFLRSVQPSTISIGVQQFYDERLHVRIAAFPGVVRSSTYVGVNTYVLHDGKPRADEPLEISAPLDDRLVRQDRFTATTGPELVPTRLDEVVVNEFAAERLGYTSAIACSSPRTHRIRSSARTS